MAGAGYSLFVAGQVLTAATVNTYLEQQTIMVFASASARDTALSVVKSEGMTAYLLDVNCLTIYSGATWSTTGPVHGAWIAYTPTWSGTIGNGSVVGLSQRIGRTINWRAQVTWGTTTSHAAALQSVTLPFAPSASYPLPSAVGFASSIQNGVDAWHGTSVLQSGSTVYVIAGTSAVSGTAARVTNLIPFTWASTAALHCLGAYEAAADA